MQLQIVVSTEVLFSSFSCVRDEQQVNNSKGLWMVMEERRRKEEHKANSKEAPRHECIIGAVAADGRCRTFREMWNLLRIVVY